MDTQPGIGAGRVSIEVGGCVLPRKVVEMYSDTWFPERLISDKWDNSLFSILLN